LKQEARVDADVIVVGAGLAGLVAAAEAADAGRRVLVLDQEPEQSLGGQAWWSFGGLFFVGSPEQKRLRVHDDVELAWQDWLGTAGFDRPEDEWPRKWARAYVEWAAGEKRAWLAGMGHSVIPVVGWAERGGAAGSGVGNSVPRFHVTWGTGPGVVEPFERRVRAAAEAGLVTFKFRHRVDALTVTAGVVDGVSGTVLVPDDGPRGTSSSREAAGEFAFTAQAVIVTSGGIGGNHDLVREAWPERLGKAPARLLSGVPAHVDGRMIGIAQQTAGAAVINADRMWHYVEGIQNWNPVWPMHGIRILPGPSSLWLDASGRRLPVPLYPGSDTLGTLEYLRGTGYDYSWFILTKRIIAKEFALSGSEQNPDITGRDRRAMLASRFGGAVPGPVQAFVDKGADFVTAPNLARLVAAMNELAGGDAPALDAAAIEREIRARDGDVTRSFGKDFQASAIRRARSYLGDRLMRVARPHALLDPAAGPLIAVRLHVLTRKSLGGLHTDLSSRVLSPAGEPVPGLYAAGEAAGFGGGGMHGYRSLEGTFLGGCLFSGRIAGRAAAAAARLARPRGLGSETVTTVTDATPWVRAVRASHDRLALLVGGLDADALRAPSYASEWSVADVLSHLGSGAEIFLLSIDAGVAGDDPPSAEDCNPVWEAWNALAPEEQAARSVAANEALVARIESLTPAERAAFHVTMFGQLPLDLTGVLGMRLSEHAVHTWDVEVALDPAARVAPDAVDLLVDSLPLMAGWTGRKAPAPVRVAVTTAGPDRAFTLDTAGVTLAPAGAGDAATASLTLPAEAFVRLVYGRLGDGAELTVSGVTVPELKSVFPGF
jgi:hypothetical protein